MYRAEFSSDFLRVVNHVRNVLLWTSYARNALEMLHSRYLERVFPGACKFSAKIFLIDFESGIYDVLRKV